MHVQNKDSAANKIHGLEDTNGSWQTNQSFIHLTILTYFRDIFSSSGPKDYSQITRGLIRRVTADMNRSLLRDVSSEEIRTAAFAIDPNKSPGDDGLTGAFFQAYWSTIGSDVVSAVQSFFRSGRILKSFNHTKITLIPKVSDVRTVHQLRPISLCTVFYKIISKVLTSRLKPIMSQIISPSQSAFLEDRLISDNVLVAHEITYYLKNKRYGKRQDMAIKLDLSKAYDRVEWGYLQHMLLTLGFDTLFVNWIMECVSTVSYSVTVNGVPTEPFFPTRGIRQGDPLSPYMFLICSEGFSHLLQQAEVHNELVGIRISRYCPSVSHLLFADDSYLFSRASFRDCENLLNLLNCYCEASGQQINMSKSSVFFSKNTPQRRRTHLASILGISIIGAQDKYLGLPSLIQRSKQETFADLKDRVRRRLEGWREQFLSLGGKETLIRSVITSIPVYYMSCFKLSKGVCADINSMVAKFWWSNPKTNTGIHWATWEFQFQVMCHSKQDGGMSFRDIEAFNLALLAKQGWRLCVARDSLFYQIFKAKYFPSVSFIDAYRGHNSSWAWQSILAGRDVLLHGLRWRVGNGMNIDCLRDPWIPSSSPFFPQLQPGTALDIGKVSELILLDPVRWDTPLVRRLFDPEDVDLILGIPLSLSHSTPDKLIWHFTKNGRYQVGSGYHVAFRILAAERPVVNIAVMPTGVDSNTFWKSVWSLSLPPKMKVFLWRLFSSKLPVGESLNKRSSKYSPMCRVCVKAVESIRHLFWECPIADRVWFASTFSLRSSRLGDVTLIEWWLSLTRLLDKDLLRLVPYILWFIWKSRNELVFTGTARTIDDILNSSSSYLDEFTHANATISDHASSTDPCPVEHPANPAAIQWQPPPFGVIKLNFDAAVDATSRVGAIGIVCRSDSGTIFSCFAHRYPNVLDPLVLEALGLRESLVVGLNLGLTFIHVKGDCQSIISAANGICTPDSRINVIILDSIRLAQSFISCDFMYTRRVCNWMAHKVARKSLVDSFLADNHTSLLEWLLGSLS